MSSEFKEVWYVWDGKGEAPKAFSGVLYASDLSSGTSGYTSPILDDLERYQSYFDLSNERTANAVAYTLGQKRRRVECKLCGGDGTLDYKKWIDCNQCNGTGKVWEYAE